MKLEQAKKEMRVALNNLLTSPHDKALTEKYSATLKTYKELKKDKN